MPAAFGQIFNTVVIIREINNRFLKTFMFYFHVVTIHLEEGCHKIMGESRKLLPYLGGYPSMAGTGRKKGISK